MSNPIWRVNEDGISWRVNVGERLFSVTCPITGTWNVNPTTPGPQWGTRGGTVQCYRAGLRCDDHGDVLCEHIRAVLAIITPQRDIDGKLIGPGEVATSGSQVIAQ